MFYRPSSTADVTNLIQSMRLCGIYTDTIPLQCYIPKKDYENLYKGYMLQEELFSRLLSEKNNECTLPDFLQDTVVYTEKIPKCRLYRNKRYTGKSTNVEEEDKGWSMKEFYQKRCVVKMYIPPSTKTGKDDFVDGVNIAKLIQWKNEKSTTLVWKMISFLSVQDTAVDLHTLKDGVYYYGTDKMFQSNIDNGKSIKARNGKLWSCRKNYTEIELNKNIMKYIK